MSKQGIDIKLMINGIRSFIPDHHVSIIYECNYVYERIDIEQGSWGASFMTSLRKVREYFNAHNPYGIQVINWEFIGTEESIIAFNLRFK